jgi:hypothetical protein
MIILLPLLSLRRISVHRNRELDGLQICGRQLAALAHDIVADLLPLIAHAGAFDHGNVDEYIFSTILRVYEAKALLGKIEKLDCTCSHFWSPLKTPIDVCVLHGIVQPGVRIQRCLEKIAVRR